MCTCVYTYVNSNVYFTCLQVTFSRSWDVIMLLSLALIRHSVLSLSEGLREMKSARHTHYQLFKFIQQQVSKGLVLIFQWTIRSKCFCVDWLVDKHGRWVWPRGLQVFHGVPLIDATLVWGDAAFIVAHPGESHASRKVVIPAWYLTHLVQHLQCRPSLCWIGKSRS